MSPLCVRCMMLVNIKMKERPSPKTIHSLLKNLFKDSFSFPARESINYPFKLRHIKEISAFASLRKTISASMTVEATILLPLFLFFVLSMGNAIEMIRLHSKMELSMWDVGRHIATYGHMLLNEEETGGVTFSAELLAGVYAKSHAEEMLGEDYLETTPLKNGADSLHFWETQLLDNGCFEVVATYEVQPDWEMLGIRPFRMANRYYGHLWNGYDIEMASYAGERSWVYVAENGMVFHENRDCTHLRLSVRAVAFSEVCEKRNNYGERYVMCQMCQKNQTQGTVYIADNGDCYHYSRTCAGLKRTVYTILRGEAKGYQPCSRCG